MKKTALTAAAAVIVGSGVMFAAPADAARIFESDDTRIDLHGRLRMGVEVNEDTTDFKNLSSRFGFRGTHTVNSDVTAFVNTEFRYDGAKVNSDAMTVRNTFLGARFSDVGSVRIGNFDSMFYQQIGSLTDLPNNTGFRALNSGGQRARGNTVAYDSADFGGVRFGASLKWQNEDEDVKEATNAVAYVGFSQGPVSVTVAYDQANSDFTDGADDSLMGARIDFDVSDDLMVGAFFEDQGDNTHIAGAIVFDYGAGDLFATVSNLDNGTDETTNFTAGVSYRISGPLSVFAEGLAGDADSVFTVGARYNF